MKTIDDVIKAYEICLNEGNCNDCPYTVFIEGRWACSLCGDCTRDALYYLKAYQGLSKMWNDRLDKEQENPPLTWDELRKMKGKPVWLEGNNIKPHWDIIARIEYDFDHDYTECEFHVLGGTFTYCDKCYGTDWNAYKKERT